MDSGSEVTPPAEGRNQLHRRAKRIQRRNAQDVCIIETEYAFGLCFEGDTTFVTETLESIASEVRKVIDSFKPDF